MRTWLWAALLIACSKDSPPSASADPPKPKAAPAPAPPPTPAPRQPTDEGDDEGYDACPKVTGERTTAARITGLHGRIIPHELGYVWHSKTIMKIYDGATSKVVRQIEPKDIPRGVIGVADDAWFVAPCPKGACDRHGTGHVLSRVDRAAGTTTEVYGPENEFAFGEVFGEYFYWGTYGIDGRTGELRRVPRKGGKVETLWSGGGVHTVLLDAGTAYVADSHSVVAIPLDGSNTRVLVKDLIDPRGMTLDAKDLYVVDRGDADDHSNGRVLRVARAGGPVKELVSKARWPTVIALDDKRIYFMGDKSGDVWALPKPGGPAAVLIPTPPGDWPCRLSSWLHRDSAALEWMRIDDGFGFIRGTQWAIPQSMIADPQKQWRDRAPTP